MFSRFTAAGICISLFHYPVKKTSSKTLNENLSFLSDVFHLLQLLLKAKTTRMSLEWSDERVMMDESEVLFPTVTSYEQWYREAGISCQQWACQCQNKEVIIGHSKGWVARMISGWQRLVLQSLSSRLKKTSASFPVPQTEKKEEELDFCGETRFLHEDRILLYVK